MWRPDSLLAGRIIFALVVVFLMFMICASASGCAHTYSDNPRNMMNMSASELKRELGKQLP